MNREALNIFTAAINSTDMVLDGLREWADTMLEGNERSEALFHINEMTNSWYDFILCLADYNGLPLT